MKELSKRIIEVALKHGADAMYIEDHPEVKTEDDLINLVDCICKDFADTIDMLKSEREGRRIIIRELEKKISKIEGIKDESK